MSLFVTFEGIEGCGKTTQIEMAGRFLQRRGTPFIITVEPGGTQVGTELRKILLKGTSLHIHERTELFLFAADRNQHVEEVIRPALNEDKVVLCDRYSDATVAYQGYGRGLDPEFVRTINDHSAGVLKPDITFLFDVPAETGLRRIADRSSRNGDPPREDRFERERIEFHRRVREGYLLLASNEPERFRVIDGIRDIETIHGEICYHLNDVLDG